MRSDVVYVHVSDVDGLVSEIETFRGNIYYYHSECFDKKAIKSVIRPSIEKWKSFWEACGSINPDNWKQRYITHPFAHAAYLTIEIQSQEVCVRYSGDYIFSDFDLGEELGERFDDVVDFEEITEIGRFIIAVRDLVGGLPFG